MQQDHKSTTRRLATAAAVATLVFPLTVLALNLVQARSGYDAGVQAVSELALGQGGWLMAIAFCCLGFGTVLVAALVKRTSEHAAVRSALLVVAGMLSFVSAAFHTDLTGAPTTTHGRIHNAAGIATFVAMLVVMAISAVRFRREPSWHGFARPTAALAAAGVLSFFLVPVLGAAHFGIAQRLLIGSFLTWIVAAALHARRRSPSPRTSQPNTTRADDESPHPAGSTSGV